MNADSMPAMEFPPAGSGPSADERFSAWLDGELDEAQAREVAGELLRRPDAQRRYAAWCMVGDALRSHEVLGEHSPRLCARITRALQDEPALLAPRALPSALGRHAASGLAIAAAAAVLVLVAVPQLRGTGDGAPGAAGTLASGPSATAVERPVAVARARDPRLDPYLQAHREVSDPGMMPAAEIYLRYGSEGER